MDTRHGIVGIWILLVLSPLLSFSITIQPQDTQEALVNPQMGWTFHYYSNLLSNYGSRLEPSDTLDDFPGLSCIYLRLPWGFIEENEGELNWSIVDTPAQRWIDRGMQVAFRFTCSESWTRYATPKWVEEAGAKGYNFTPGAVDPNGPYWEPDYGDPVFLEKLDHFLAAAAARYDGNPHVAFIDIGSFGVWGEGHTFASTKMQYPAEVLKKHIDLYLKHFKKTLLNVNDDFAFQGGNEPGLNIEKYPGLGIITYGLEHGCTLRDDSILVQAPPKHYYNAEMAQWFWPTVPVILENEHYGSSRDRGNWGDGSKYLEAVEAYHASYVSIHWWPREFLSEQVDLIKKINLRLGYRLQLQEITWPEKVSLNQPFIVSMKWANTGVAPCYPGGKIALTLKDNQGGIVAVFVDESFNVKTLQPGPVGSPLAQDINMECAFPQNRSSVMIPGKYDLWISVGEQEGTPMLALPLKDNDGHRRYKMGQLEVIGTE